MTEDITGGTSVSKELAARLFYLFDKFFIGNGPVFVRLKFAHWPSPGNYSGELTTSKWSKSQRQIS